ncbi:putative Fe-containing alcohol dehydrogenase [Roridomyces roridus]|uniref:Fe-containing alcohol dehydrogenase n=1 Tax=Roridomyces roridus TaxID=1738132 RepID=A0AAD7BMP3_9AGAR|nr:putative Fe-containing alcohol dehydrogenase [Roridomyces roridus]
MAETYRPAVAQYPSVLPRSRAPTVLGEVFNNCDVSDGLPFPVSCAKHAEETFHAKRIFVLASSTLANNTSALNDLRASLGDKVIGVKTGLKSHTYFSDVLQIAAECRQQQVDLIVTLGGGSLTDAAKMVSLALANEVTQPDDLLKLPTSRTRDAPRGKPPVVPVICITTTLSAGEFTLGAGVTDDRDDKKHQFLFPRAIRLVIFDPSLLTAHTPTSLLLQSGFRSVDHCVESFCSLNSNEVTELHATRGLKQLVPALLRCKADAEAKTDVDARLAAQLASIDAIAAGMRVYTPMGASHGIGHMLGPFGVGHGHTSCVLLPAVCKYNKKNGSSEVAERQKRLVELLWDIPEVRMLAESRALSEVDADLGDLLGGLVSGLGMPRTLAEVGVGWDRFEQLAEYSLLDVWCATNPVPLTEKGQVMEILEMVAE